MTAESFAELVDARRVGPGRWLARCPAHDDKHPSLAIAQGERAVLIVCRSRGCTVEAICKSIGIRTSDLFHATLTPEQRQQAAQAKATRDLELARQHAREREQRDRIFKLEKLMASIGAKLARNPEDRELGQLFHRTCDRLHDAEANLPHLEDGGHRMQESPAIPASVHGALMDLAQSFDRKETARYKRAA